MNALAILGKILSAFLALPARVQLAIGGVVAFFLAWATVGDAFVAYVQGLVPAATAWTLFTLAPILPGTLLTVGLRGNNRFTPGWPGRFIPVAVFITAAIGVLAYEWLVLGPRLETSLMASYASFAAGLTFPTAILTLIIGAIVALVAPTFTWGLSFGITPERISRLVWRVRW